MSLKTLLSPKKRPAPVSALPDHTARSDDHTPRVAVSEQGFVTYASPAFCALVGLSSETLKTQAFLDLLTIRVLDKPLTALSDIPAGLHTVTLKGQTGTFLFQCDWLKTQDNTRYLVCSQESLFQDTQTPAQGFAQSDLQHLLDISHHIMVICGPEGALLQANAAFYKLFISGPVDYTALNFLEILKRTTRTPHLETLAGAPDNSVHVLESESPSMGQGEPFWIEWRIERTNGKFYAAGHDVTAIKRQEQALNVREKQLTEAESLGRMGHWTWTLGQDTFQWSDELYRIFGVEKGQFTPSLDSMTGMVHRHDVARVNQIFQRALIEENDYDMEFRLIRPDGDIRTLRCEGRCARDSKGEVHALYGIMQDMTERFLYEKQLREAKESAEHAYAARTQFLANMSHELRTPLNAIIGFSEMMERQILGPIGTPKYLEYIGGIKESGEHLLDLINDILDMSKIEAGKYELDVEPFAIAKVLKLAVHMMEGRAHESGVSLRIDSAPDDTRSITADRRAVMQILLNLLSNAIKFSHNGGEVQVQCLERDGYILLKVVDHGIGIPASKLNSITKPFEQVSSSYVRNHEGSGLGLAITKELTEMHGGVLMIDSTLGEGTTVTVRLPDVPSPKTGGNTQP